MTGPAPWKHLALGELGSIYGGGTPSTKVPEYWGGSIPWLTPGEVTLVDGLYVDRTERSISEGGLQNSSARLMPVGSVLMTSRASIGDAVINSVPMATNQGFINIECADLVDNGFLCYWIAHNKARIQSRASGSTFREISRSVFKTIEIDLPPLPEQKAIARALRAVQEAKQARERELELERERKAALMEHLFTHGTRNEPTKMTEIGEVPKDWDVVPLRDVIAGKAQNGAFIKKPEWGHGTLYANVVDMYGDPMLEWSSVQRLGCRESLLRTYGLADGDVLFVRSSLKREGVAQCCMVKGVPEAAVFDCHLIRVTPNRHVINPLFMTYFFRSDRGRASLIARSKTTTMTTINQDGLVMSSLPLPQIGEQNDIAECLEACDARGSALQKEISVTAELLAALLEELMTGRLSAVALIET